MTQSSQLEDRSYGFASNFKSSIFTVYVGSERTTYRLHQEVLICSCPYFKSQLSFGGTESSSSSATLTTAVDTEQAFDMFVEFIYQGFYTVPEYLKKPWQALLHAEVYVLAERLLMTDLKELALKNMAKTLAKCYETKAAPQEAKGFGNAQRVSDSGSRKQKMDPACLVQLIDTVYEYTAGPSQSMDDAEGEAKTEGAKGKTKEKSTAEAEGAEGESWEAEVGSVPSASPKQRIQKQASPRLMPRDRMRILIARYSASRLSTLKQSPKFLQVLRTRPDFSNDILLETLPRDRPVTEDEASRL